MYEVASRITERLINEYLRGKTYRVEPRVVVRQYCKYLTKEFLAEQVYARYDSLDASSAQVDNDGSEVPHPEVVGPSRPIADAVVDSLLVTELLGTESLTAGEREVLKMKYVNDLDIDQIARALGIKRNAVDQRLHRGINRLRDLCRGA